MERLNIGLLYVSLYNQLKKNVGVDRCVDRKTFFCIVGKHFLIPKNLRVVIIKELINKNLVEQQENGSIRILDCDIDLEKDANKLYQICGIY